MKTTLTLAAAVLSLTLLSGCFEEEAEQKTPAAVEAAKPAPVAADDAAESAAESAAEPTALSASEWIAEDINGGGVIDRLQLTLNIDADGKVSGYSGCNRFGGQADISDAAGGKVGLGALFSTRMACMDEARGNQEAKFLAALGEVANWRVENGLLYLSNNAGADVLRFSNADHTTKPAE